MAKRRTNAVLSDNEEAQSSPPSKRARTQDSSDDDEVKVEILSEAKRGGRKSKTKSRRAGSDDEGDEEDGDNGQNNEADEKEFEEQHGERIRAQIEARRKVQGGVAEFGIIEAIEMHQFMCHRYLTFNFGPQINFIIGHNGSGKSAVLSAITVALGGKATSTGRGNGLKSFIREGQSAAEVTIMLKNQGEEAYKPKEYGKSIVITRRFTKEGSSSWKIKSKDGKVISTKKEELAAICDHMNIQVDNPLNVLTQDAARQFLSSSHPSEKYKFFLRGTQLSQLSEEYDLCLENIKQTTKILSQKKEAIPELRKAFKDATVRFEEASKAREQRHKEDELKKELAWAHVKSKEDEMIAQVEKVAKMERRVPKLREPFEKADIAVANASLKVEALERDHHELGDVGHLITTRQELLDKMRTNRNKLSEITNDERQMNDSMKATNVQIEHLQNCIDEEIKRRAANTEAKRAEMNIRVQEAHAKVQEADANMKDLNERMRGHSEARDDAKKQADAVGLEMTAAQNRIMDCDSCIERCHTQQKNKLNVYGTDIPGLLDQIRKMRWHGDMPVGPLGMFVKLKDTMWADILRIHIGSLMYAFVCTDPRDRVQLKRLLEHSKNHMASIIISERDIFDYSQGEPPSHYLTILRALEVSDPFVLRVLINQARIERLFLTETRRAAQALLESIHGGGGGIMTAMTGDCFRVNKYSDGGWNSAVLQKLSRHDQKQGLFVNEDASFQLRKWEEDKAQATGTLEELQKKLRDLQQVQREATRSLQELDKQSHDAHKRLAIARGDLQQAEEAMKEELPTDIAGLAEAKIEAEKERESIMSQFEALQRDKANTNAAQQPLLQKANALKAEIESFDEKRNNITAQIEEAAADRLKAQNEKKWYQDKLAEEERKIKAEQEQADILKVEFDNWEKKASEYCERFENPRKVDDVTRNLKSVQAALAEREKRQGATVEEMTIEVNKAKANLDIAERDLKAMSQLNKALRAALIMRLAKWQEFRRHIALRCKLVFQYHLSNRGYFGKVIFDHQNATLQLKVQTDDQASTQSRDKDPRSLSGGEKSFSTICLLLSLWDSIGCPLRCLDEFDVFMDAVNRRISMRMMIDTANASDKKQYILITPQDMNNVAIGQSVRVHRMTDPERGQGTLRFS